MIIIEFLGYLAALTILTLIIVVTKNAVDAELVKMTIQKKVKKALIQSLYYLERANEEIRKDINEMCELLDSEDIDGMKEYLSSVPPEELEREWNNVTQGKMPFELKDILGDKDE